MKPSIFLFLLLFVVATACAQYKPVDKRSSVTFTIKNFGINTGGSFSGLQGEVNFDNRDLTKAGVNVWVDANSINTDNQTRDEHLRQDTYFDVKAYPRISFVSTRITVSGQTGVLLIFGKLTIKNQTREISFPFTATPDGNGYVFKGAFSINRKDFGVGGTSIISNNLDVQLSILATK